MLRNSRLDRTFGILPCEEARPFDVRRDVVADRGQPRYDARRGKGGRPAWRVHTVRCADGEGRIGNGCVPFVVAIEVEDGVGDFLK